MTPLKKDKRAKIASETGFILSKKDLENRNVIPTDSLFDLLANGKLSDLAMGYIHRQDSRSVEEKLSSLTTAHAKLGGFIKDYSIIRLKVRLKYVLQKLNFPPSRNMLTEILNISKDRFDTIFCKVADEGKAKRVGAHIKGIRQVRELFTKVGGRPNTTIFFQDIPNTPYPDSFYAYSIDKALQQEVKIQNSEYTELLKTYKNYKSNWYLKDRELRQWERIAHFLVDKHVGQWFSKDKLRQLLTVKEELAPAYDKKFKSIVAILIEAGVIREQLNQYNTLGVVVNSNWNQNTKQKKVGD